MDPKQTAIPCIITPPARNGDKKVKAVGDFLDFIRTWREDQKLEEDGGFLGQLWYRGVPKVFPNQKPGVYRDCFTERAIRLNVRNRVKEEQRLHLECNL